MKLWAIGVAFQGEDLNWNTNSVNPKVNLRDP